jgi:hypothetical protein
MPGLDYPSTRRSIQEHADTVAPPNQGAALVGGASGVPGDGLVSVAETRLEGSTEHHLVPAIHTFLMNHPAVIRGAVSFLGRAPDS